MTTPLYRGLIGLLWGATMFLDSIASAALARQPVWNVIIAGCAGAVLTCAVADLIRAYSERAR